MKPFFVLSRRFLLVVFLVLSFFLMIFCQFTSSAIKETNGDTHKKRIDYINSLGYQVDENTATDKEVIIPLNFSNVYFNYNLLQQKAGFDLSDFKGKTVKKYSYKVLNYKKENYYLNLLVLDGIIIGGDISSTNISGEMLPLLSNKQWIMEKIRLDKFIASQLNITRKEATIAIKKGLVSVNSNIIKDRSFVFDADADIVLYDGQAVEYKKFIYILMNKPKGVLSASSDKKQKTVIDLIPDNLRRPDLFPVGRLDKDTTGLLIITDDGDFAHKVISPKSLIPKTYIANLDGDITPDMVKMFADGVVLADNYKCKPAILERVCENTARITITEGKYHQIKRMFGVVNLGVNSLHRESIGEIFIPNNLKFGECVEILSNQARSLCL